MKYENCKFANYDNIDLTYYCFKNEVCCKLGCCITPLRKLTHLWYFWLVLILICVLTLSCLQYSKRVRLAARHRHLHARLNRGALTLPGYNNTCPRIGLSGMDMRALANGHRHTLADEMGFQHLQHRRDSPHNRCLSSHGNFLQHLSDSDADGGINNIILDHLLVSYNRNANRTTENNLNPPDYDTLSLRKDAVIIVDPPAYSTVCDIPRKSPDEPAVATHNFHAVSSPQNTTTIKTESDLVTNTSTGVSVAGVLKAISSTDIVSFSETLSNPIDRNIQITNPNFALNTNVDVCPADNLTRAMRDQSENSDNQKDTHETAPLN